MTNLSGRKVAATQQNVWHQQKNRYISRETDQEYE